jgi:hypothetical protein
LKELEEFGLIKVTRRHHLGQTRAIYFFLRHALISFEAKTAPRAAVKPPQNAKALVAGDVPKTQKRCAKNDISYNKEESFIDNNNIPPTPQNDLGLAEAELLPVDDAPEEGEEVIFGVPEENSKEDLAWIQAKKLLAEKLSEYTLQAWIAPIQYEKSDCQAVLRLPNPVFIRIVQREYGKELAEALKAVGIPKLRFDVLTPEQQAALEEKARIKAEAEEKKKLAARMKAAEAERRAQDKVENLPPCEKFEMLFAAYPVKKEREAAERNFMRLYRKGELPPMAELFSSIKDHQAKDRWWREKMPPLLGNWLAKKKWRDKPYD